MSPPTDRRAGGLRERKKARTREAIQSCAMELFARQGYDGTTVDQIIEAAEVSESTFYRYFPTKAAVALYDDYDPRLVEAFMSQPPGLTTVQALRAAFRTVFGDMSAAEDAAVRGRLELMLSVPELRVTIFDQLADAMRLLADIIGARNVRPPDEFAVRTLAGAVIGQAIGAMFTMAEDPSSDLGSLMDQALAALEAGVDL
ncbi:MAG: TetR/AcrR family transcriptional regulator [Acidimicrobiales bacterium]